MSSYLKGHFIFFPENKSLYLFQGGLIFRLDLNVNIPSWKALSDVPPKTHPKTHHVETKNGLVYILYSVSAVRGNITSDCYSVSEFDPISNTVTKACVLDSPVESFRVIGNGLLVTASKLVGVQIWDINTGNRLLNLTTSGVAAGAKTLEVLEDGSVVAVMDDNTLVVHSSDKLNNILRGQSDNEEEVYSNRNTTTHF